MSEISKPNLRARSINFLRSHREEIFEGGVMFSLILHPILFLFLYLVQEAPSATLFFSDCAISLGIFSFYLGARDERKKKENRKTSKIMEVEN